jgi:hypothetical protein
MTKEMEHKSRKKESVQVERGDAPEDPGRTPEDRGRMPG